MPADLVTWRTVAPGTHYGDGCEWNWRALREDGRWLLFGAHFRGRRFRSLTAAKTAAENAERERWEAKYGRPAGGDHADR